MTGKKGGKRTARTWKQRRRRALLLMAALLLGVSGLLLCSRALERLAEEGKILGQFEALASDAGTEEGEEALSLPDGFDESFFDTSGFELKAMDQELGLIYLNCSEQREYCVMLLDEGLMRKGWKRGESAVEGVLCYSCENVETGPWQGSRSLLVCVYEYEDCCSVVLQIA